MSIKPARSFTALAIFAEKRMLELLKKEDDSKRLFIHLVTECQMDARIAHSLYAACKNYRRTYDLDRRVLQCYLKGEADRHDITAMQNTSFGIFENFPEVYGAATLNGQISWDELVSHITHAERREYKNANNL